MPPETQDPTTPQKAPEPFSPDWSSLVDPIAKHNGVDPELVRRVINAESRGVPGAVSPKGAQGLMQLMPDTSKRYNIDPLDPIQNIGAGTVELARLLKKYNGHYGKAVAAYNAGESRVDDVNGIPNIKETQDYVLKVLEGYNPPKPPTGTPVTRASQTPDNTGVGALRTVLPTAEASAMQAKTIGPQTAPSVGFFEALMHPGAAAEFARQITRQPRPDQFPLLPGESRGAVDPTRAMTPFQQEAHPVMAGAAKFVAGSTTPENLAVMAATAGIGTVPGVARATGAGFATAMGVGAVDQTGRAVTDWEAGRRGQAKEEATEAALSVATAGLVGWRSMKGFVPEVPTTRSAIMESIPEQPRTPSGPVTEVGPRVRPQGPQALPPSAPSVTPTLRPEVAEMAKPVALRPEQTTELIDRYNSIADNPRATPEDISHAQQRLSELGALQKVVPAISRPEAAARTVPQIVASVPDPITGRSTVKSLPLAEVQQLAELNPQQAKASGLSHNDHLMAKKVVRDSQAPTEVTTGGEPTPGATVHQALTRVVRARGTEDLRRRQDEFLETIQTASSASPDVKEKVATTLQHRSEQSAQLAESLGRIRDASDFAKSVTDELRTNLAGKLVSGEQVGIDPRTNQPVVSPETEVEGVDRPSRGQFFVSAVSHEARQYLNIVRGNMVGGAYGKGATPRYKLSRDPETGAPNMPTKLSPEEKQARVELANTIQNKLNEHFRDVWEQGGVPTPEQRSEGTNLISLLQSTTGKRLLFSGKQPFAATEDPQSIAPGRAWMNWAMRRPATSHFAKPTTEQLNARIAELDHERSIAEMSAGVLRKSLPKDHVGNPDAPQPVKQVASTPTPAALDAKSLASAAGLVYKGEVMPGSGVHMFEHPSQPGQTMAVQAGDIPDTGGVGFLKNRMATKLAEFAAKPSPISIAAPSPRYAYRVRDVGEEGVPAKTRSQATLSREEAESYRFSRGQVTGKPQELVRFDLSKLPAEHYTEFAGPRDAAWIKLNKPLGEESVERLPKPTQEVPVKRYDPTGKLVSESVEPVAAPTQEEATPAAKREDLSKMYTHLANLELRGQGGTRTAQRIRLAIQQYESVIGPGEVNQGFITSTASNLLYEGAKAEKAARPKQYTTAADNGHENKGDDLVALLSTASGEAVPRALHGAILKLHDLTPADDRDYLAHAAITSGMAKGIDEVARRYALALSTLREGLKAGKGPQALQDANYVAQKGVRPTKGQPSEAGFITPMFIPDILNELGKYASNAKATAVDVIKWAGRWLSQGSYASVSLESRNAMFKFRGELNRIEDLGRVAFNDGITAVRALPTDQQDALMARAQQGLALPTQDLQGMRDVLQQLQDQHYVRLRELKPSLPYWRDHIGTIWEKAPNNAAELFEKHANAVNHAVLQGDRGMLRQRVYETVLDGIKHGGVPATHNLFEMALLDLGRQAQYIHANTELLPAIKAQGRLARGPEEAAKLRAAGSMPNPVRVPDNIVSTWFPVETAEGGTVIAKGAPYYMEAGELKMLQNWLAPDFVRKNVVGRTLLNFKNIYTPIELFGPFHLASIVAKSSALGLSQGLNRAFNAGVLQNDLGNAVDGLKDMLTGLAMPFTAYKNGRILREAGGQTLVGWQKFNYDKQRWLNSPDGQRLSKVIPNLEDTIDGLLEAGARLDVNPTYATRWRQAVVQSWMDRKFIKSASMVPFAALEQITSPLFQKYIPAVKLFAAAKEINVELARQAPLIQSGEISKEAVMQAAVRRVDNILGELNWENLNASRGMRSLAMLAWRSPGWRGGTVDLVKNAGFGQAKDVFEAARNRRVPTIDPNLMYIMSMLGMGAAIATTIMALMAHKAPSSMTDLTNPQTGQVDSRGKPIRLDLPLYTSRDIPEIMTNPFGYATGGQTGFVSRTTEAVKNRTYQGSLVTENKGLKAFAERAAHSSVPVPFSYTGYQRMKSQGFPATQGIILNTLGLNPSRRDLDMTEAERVLSDAERRFSITRDAKETAKLQAKQAIEGAYLNGRYDDLRVLQVKALNEGTLTFKELEKALDDAKKPYIERMAGASAVRPKDLLKAYQVGTESERRELMPFIWKAISKDEAAAKQFQGLVQGGKQ